MFDESVFLLWYLAVGFQAYHYHEETTPECITIDESL